MLTMRFRKIARKIGLPIWQLLGGKLRTKLKVYAWIGGDRPADVETQAYDSLEPFDCRFGTCSPNDNL